MKGRAEEVKNLHEVLDTMAFPLFPWHAGRKHRFVRIVPSAVSGRRFHVLDPSAWPMPMADAPARIAGMSESYRAVLRQRASASSLSGCCCRSVSPCMRRGLVRPAIAGA